MKSDERSATVERKTSETDISVILKIDGNGDASVATGIPFLNHMLKTLAFYAGFDIKINAKGDLNHHIIEDVAISLGDALNKAMGERNNIKRFGHSIVPMDDSLALVALDMVRRPYAAVTIPTGEVDGIPTGLISHFIRSLSMSAIATIHVKVLYGDDPHHSVEAVFKALGLAIKDALILEERGINSTKGKI